MLDLLPDPMHEPTLIAIPFFLALLIAEWLAAWKLEDHDEDGPDSGRSRPPRGAYEKRDARASITMGLVSIATSTAWKVLGLLVYTAIFVYLAPWQLPITAWYTWVIGFVAVDVLYYWNHRISHRVRLVWATHQAHHSSEYFNFATALRQKWNISAALVMWLPLPFLGVPPAVVFAAYGVNLVYQFWIHTERIDRLWAPIEFVLNTPSHHRVHHGSDPEYLDRNYAGVFILWDRMFGSFRAETHRPRYGLTSPVDTYNIWKLQTREYVAIARDVRSAKGLRARIGYIVGPPGWAPSPAPGAKRAGRMDPPREVSESAAAVNSR
ncbi:sterol desaturase family protein [Gordonia sp. DT30]|uniref:sterol desaturase family protein n=1 Tax=Gordonia sp. DT30 TaxID=3416546 RepID=UPI003CF49AE8